MLKTYLCLIIACAFGMLYGQDSTQTAIFSKRNTILVGLAGEGSIISLSYERRVGITPNSFFTGKLGLGFSQTTTGLYKPVTQDYLVIPAQISVNIGAKKYFFELGMGLANYRPLTSSQLSSYHIPYPIIGFRIQDDEEASGCFRIFVCPPIGAGNSFSNTPYFLPVGISFGKSF